MASRKTLFVYVLIVVLGIGLVLAGLWRRAGSAGVTRIGSVLVLTGDYKSLGEQIRDGQLLAAEELNADRARKTKIEMVFYDSQGEKSLALEKVKMLKRDGIDFIGEIFGSGPALHCIPFITAQRMLFVSGVDTGPDLTAQGGRNFFRIIPSDTVAAGQLARWAVARGLTRGAIVYLNDTWGAALRSELERVYRAMGGRVVAVQEIAPNQDVFQPVVASLASGLALPAGDRMVSTALRKTSPEQLAAGAVFVFIHPREAALLLVEARKQKFNGMFMGTDSLTGAELVGLGGKAILGAGYVVTGAAKEFEQTRRFKQLYERKFGAGKQPPLFSVMGYDALRVLVHAIDESGGDVDRAIQLLEKARLQGASGEISFDANHDLVSRGFDRMIYSDRDGRVVAVNEAALVRTP